MIALSLKESFDRYSSKFQQITHGAKERFERRQWKEAIDSAQTRYDFFAEAIREVAEQIVVRYGESLHDPETWKKIKAEFNLLFEKRYDVDIALTFFYAVRRTLLNAEKHGFDYVDEAYLVPREIKSDGYPYTNFSKEDKSIADTLRNVVTSYKFDVPFYDLDRRIELAAKRIEQILVNKTGSPHFDRIQALEPVFYRNKGCYLVCRIQSHPVVNFPLVLHLENTKDGIELNAVIMDRDDVRNVFGYSVSSFHVDTRWHREVVDFLVTLFDQKKGMERAAMYHSLGYHAHAKTVLFKEMHEFLQQHEEARFQLPDGILGTTTSVLMLPGFRYVFKIIQDTNIIQRESKKRELTRELILMQYRGMNKADRVGRILASDEFEDLRFPKKLFPEEILEYLKFHASENIVVTDTEVILKNVFLQRKVSPLVHFLPNAEPEKARKALIDYGHCVHDMAYAGLYDHDRETLRNYGVTSSGKVVLYDPDEIVPIRQFKCAPPTTGAWTQNLSDEWVDEQIARLGYDPLMFEGCAERPHMIAAAFPGVDLTQYASYYYAIPEADLPAWNAVHDRLHAQSFWDEVNDKLDKGYTLRFYPFPRNCLLIQPESQTLLDPPVTAELTPPARQRLLFDTPEETEVSI